MLKSNSTATEDAPVKEGSRGAFWNGVIVGVVVWVAIIAVILVMWCCCKKSSVVESN